MCVSDQLPSYFLFNIKDTYAGYNAFNYHWDRDVVLYMNSSWSLLDQVIDKIIADKSAVLLATPRWFHLRHGEVQGQEVLVSPPTEAEDILLQAL